MSEETKNAADEMIVKDEAVERAAEKRDLQNTAVLLNEKRHLSEPLTDAEAKNQMSQKSRRNFLIGGATALIGVFGWRWMPDEMKSSLLDKTFRFNEKVAQIFYSPKSLAPEFPLSRAAEIRENGDAGLSEDFDAANWKLSVGGLANRREDLILTLDDIKKLPRTEMTTEFKCIEGWSVIVNWAGVRFSDFAAHYAPQTRSGNVADVQNNPADLPKYVSFVTPDEGYYVGWDLPSVLHPQTLLAYEMNGAPLTAAHGAPLRIASPTKYGIKQIKRIGRIEFTDERPKDYWNERGYDWYAGH